MMSGTWQTQKSAQPIEPPPHALRPTDSCAMVIFDARADLTNGPEREMRIPPTFPALASSRHVVFIVAEKEKPDIFARFRRGDDTLPSGELIWFVDEAVARGTES
jgi:hypothetical protein